MSDTRSDYHTDMAGKHAEMADAHREWEYDADYSQLYPDSGKKRVPGAAHAHKKAGEAHHEAYRLHDDAARAPAGSPLATKISTSALKATDAAIAASRASSPEGRGGVRAMFGKGAMSGGGAS